MGKSRRFRRFEVETCARVARPKKQKNRASLRRRILGNPLKNSKKNCCQMNSDERGVQVHGKVSTFSRFWSWNLRTSRTTEEARKSCLTTSKSSWKSFEEFEKKLLSDNFSWKSRQKFWSWNLRTSRTTEEAKKSRQTTSSNSSKSIEELEKPVSCTKQNHLFELLILFYFVFQSSQLSQKSFWQFSNLSFFHGFMILLKPCLER